MITETSSINFIQVLPPTPPEEFVDWLKGFSDAIGDNCPTVEQWKRIRDRLSVTKKQTLDTTPNQPWNPWTYPINPLPNMPIVTYTVPNASMGGVTTITTTN